jgi:hypothetical protein
VSSAQDHVTPHILTLKTRLWLRNFVLKDAKRLLQQYLPKADISTAKLAGEKVATPASRRAGKIVSRASNWLASIIKRIPYRLR